MRGFQATAARSLCSAALAFFLVGYDGDYEDDRGYSEYEDYASWYREQKEEAAPTSGEFSQWLKDAEKRFPQLVFPTGLAGPRSVNGGALPPDRPGSTPGEGAAE